MKIEKISEIIKMATKKTGTPLIDVAYLFSKNKMVSVEKYCGKLDAWNEYEGILWVRHGGKKTRKGVFPPIQFFADDILSLKVVSIEGLVDKCNALYQICSVFGREKKKIV